MLGINITIGDFVNEIARAIRYHIDRYLKVNMTDIIKSQLGLGHSYSRMKCMFDVNRQDKPIIQSIALIDQLDKNINSFCMRIKEWFGWHFPELARIVSDNGMYVRIVHLIEVNYF
jgi:nucleolar protein 56